MAITSLACFTCSHQVLYRKRFQMLDGKSETLARWPHINRFLWVDSSGRVEDDFPRWLRLEATASPAERAAANDEWADFFEWRLEHRAHELANDQAGRRLAAKWTDSIAYSCRRLAMMARGDDPGEPVPQHVRRPDLDGTGRAGNQGTTGRASSKMAPASSAL